MHPEKQAGDGRGDCNQAKGAIEAPKITSASAGESRTNQGDHNPKIHLREALCLQEGIASKQKMWFAASRGCCPGKWCQPKAGLPGAASVGEDPEANSSCAPTACGLCWYMAKLVAEVSRFGFKSLLIFFSGCLSLVKSLSHSGPRFSLSGKWE